MAIIKKSEIIKMNKEEQTAKIRELALELIKAQVTSKKATAKTKEIKRTIARLKTAMRLSKAGSAKEKKNGN